jgi:hypothetical protein
MTRKTLELPECVLILRELSAYGAETCNGLMQVLNRDSRRTVNRYLRALHAAHKIYIYGWEVKRNTGGSPARIWMIGDERDAPKPKKSTHAQNAKRHRDSKRTAWSKKVEKGARERQQDFENVPFTVDYDNDCAPD